ncbi:hypothetical protein HMPREF9163_01419 [Selenomonas sp. oral taxon 138 str. F0429]|nr:hypothetical protein HMPREF9163_01419 [Selenomonas sp. oral taxon 138 str. F0429]
MRHLHDFLNARIAIPGATADRHRIEHERCHPFAGLSLMEFVHRRNCKDTKRTRQPFEYLAHLSFLTRATKAAESPIKSAPFRQYFIRASLILPEKRRTNPHS